MDTSRRIFLRNVTRVAAGVAALRAAGPTPEARAQEPLRPHGLAESYWEDVKAAFPLKPGTVMLNTGNLAPSPSSVIDAVLAAVRDIEADASAQNRAKFAVIRETARTRLAQLIGAAADEIALVRNASEANSIIVNGLPLGPGDEVVIFDQNHESNHVAWAVRAARDGFTIKTVVVKGSPASPEELRHLFVGAIGPATKLITFSDISNVSGLMLPVRDICHAARERGVFTHIDGAQSLGAVRLDVHDLGCDSYAASAHKWLMGPKEVGLLYVRAERIAELWPGVVSQDWGSGPETIVGGARKYECVGQRNDALIAGLVPSCEFHAAIGADVIEARVYELAALLMRGISEIAGVRMVTPMSPKMSAGVVVFDFPDGDNRRIYESLYAQHGIAGSTKGGLRLCPHVFNTRADVERAVKAVWSAAKA